ELFMTYLYLITEKTIKIKKLLFGLTSFVVLTFNSCTTDTDKIKLFPIKAGEKWGYVDSKGQYVINSQFEDAYNFSEGLALVKSADGKYGFIDEDGKYVINPIYKDANSFSEGLACVVMENGKPQFIDKNNKILFTVDKAEYCFGFKEGLARVIIKGKYGFIDKTGKIIISPIYEEAQDFKEGLAAVAKKDEKTDEVLWGYIDKTGAVKINFQFVGKLFCTPGSFSDGLAFTSSDGMQWGCIDKDGKYQINPQFEGDFVNRYKFINGVSLVSQGGSYGYIDKKGKYIINPQFKDARRFSANNLAAVQHSDGKWGFINKEGKYEINPQFEEVAIGFFGKIAFVKSSDKYGIIDQKGLYIVNPQFDDVKLYDIGSNYGVKTDFVDYDGIAQMIFEKCSSNQYFGYDNKTTLGKIIDDYPYVDISDLEPYSLEIENPKITLSDMVEISSLNLGFGEKTYSETPIYKTVQKYNYYYGYYYYDKEFVKMDKKIQTSSPLCYAALEFTLQSSGKGKGKTLAEAIKDQAIKKMKVTEVTDLDIKNTDFKGMYILKNSDLLVHIIYTQDEDDEESEPTLIVGVVNKNYGISFDELAEKLVENYNE
ncbi:MAG: WG repeat-containing protein, partial [Candidatus Calescibacterium sp.]|nr:WG repeat-containing protein [Candidatus Calescibacterium sp.]